MKIIFASSSGIALHCLETLSNEDFCTLNAVLTNPDSAKGRKKELMPNEIAAGAALLSEKRIHRGKEAIKIIKAPDLKGSHFNEIADLKADLLVVFSYGRIFSTQFLSLFPLGGINIHPSLLPKYRGAAPIQAAILNRDTETGISIQYLAAKLDSGDILAQETIPLSRTETTTDLSKIVGEKAPLMLVPVLRSIAEGKARSVRQNNEKASYFGTLKKEDGRIDWKESAEVIDARIRAFTPWPLSGTMHNGNELFILAGKVYTGIIEAGTERNPGRAESLPGTVIGVDKDAGILIQTGCGVYCAHSLQYKTKKVLDWKSFLNGARDFEGSVLI